MKKPFFLHRAMAFCLAALMLMSCAVLPARAKTLDWQVSLLHPENFFGEADEIRYNDEKDAMEYFFTVRRDPKSDLEDFARILTETEDITLEKNKKTLFGDRKLELKYTDRDCVSIHWDKSEKLLTVTYEAIAASLWENEEKQIYGYTAEAYPEQFVTAMLDTYADNYGLDSIEETKLKSGDRIIEVGGKNRVRFDWHEGASLLELTYFKGWDDPAEQKEAAKETAPEESAAKEEAVNVYGHALPDLASFLDTKYTQDEWGYTHYVTCLVDKNQKDEIVKAVVDLLLEPRYLLKQMDTQSDSDGKHYTFEYTGKYADMDWVYLKAGGKYHVKLTVKSYSSSQTALILYSYPEFYLEDPGSRFEATTPKSSSETKSTIGKEEDCPDCSGGSCGSCGGDGYLDGLMAGVIGVQRNIQDCPACNGGSCRRCYGSGRIRK